jgi:hypothetical protein
VKFWRFGPLNLKALFVALALMLLIFPDVIFLGSSLRLTDQLEGSNTGKKSIQFYKIPTTTGWWGSYSDTGGAIFQAEPMISLMKRNIRELQSPYWNPYSAAGSLGPETLVDQNFSPFTILNAVLGDSSIVFNLTYIFISVLSAYFVYILVADTLGLSIFASIGASIFYLLNGYVAANIASNTLQSFYYIPLVLYASFKFIDFGGLKNYSLMVLAWALIFACTFLPTTIISVLAISILISGYIAFSYKERKISAIEILGLLFSLFASGVSAVLLLAIIYFPLIENLGTMGTLGDYAKRVFYPINFPQAIASLYTPTHLFESYNAMEAGAIFWNDGRTKNGINGNTVYHIGLIAIILSASACSYLKGKYKPLIIFCFICLGIGFLRLFGVGFIEQYYSSLPVIGNIGAQYWWPMIFLPLTLLVAFGFEAYVRGIQTRWIGIVFILIGALSIYYVYIIFGLKDPNLVFKLNGLKISLAFSLTVGIVIVSSKFTNKKYLAPALMIFFLFAELTYSAKFQREPSVNFFNSPSAEIEFIQKNIKMNRTMNIGGGGLYPELGSAFGIQEVTSLNQGIVPAYLNYFGKMIQLENKHLMSYGASLLNMKDEPESNRIDWDRVNLLGIKYILLPKNFVRYQKYLKNNGFALVYEGSSKDIYENPHPISRAFSIPLLDKKIDNNINFDLINKSTKTVISISEYKNDLVRLEGEAKERSLVVLTDNYTSPWVASVNGKPSRILTIDGVFRGVMVEPGHFSLVFKYSLKYLNLAIFISIAMLVLIIAGLFVRLDKKKKY